MITEYCLRHRAPLLPLLGGGYVCFTCQQEAGAGEPGGTP